MDKPTQGKPAHVVRLLQNTIYPTYQLYAQMANKKTPPEDGLRLAALITLHWVKQRLGDARVEELDDLPEVETYSAAGDDCLRSFHVSRGFLIDVVSLPSKGIWTLHISEPDLGSDPGNPEQVRQAVPGRVIETNVAFQVDKPALNCGFQILVSDPAGTAQKAEVYRLAIIRQLIAQPDFGLKQITPLTAQVRKIANAEQLKDFWELCRSPGNQLPNVVFTQAKQTMPSLESLPKISEMGISFSPRLSVPQGVPPAAPSPQPSYDYDTFARRTMAYCRTYLLEAGLEEKLAGLLHTSLLANSIVIVEPSCLGGKKTVLPPKSSRQRQEEQLEQLRQTMCTYPREKEISFGNISFLSAARESLLQNTKELVRQSKELSLEWLQRIEQLEGQWKETLDKKDRAYEALLDKLNGQKEHSAQMERKMEELKARQTEREQTWQLASARQEEQIVYLRRKLSQPDALRDIAAWTEKYFKDKLLLLPVAADMLSDRSLHADVGLICDALDFLATDYWDCRYLRTAKEEMQTRCSEKYHRPFEVKPIGEATVHMYPREYRVKYTFSGETRRREVPFDSHLCVGTDAEKLVRIYFFHDDEKQLIVIGSLPRHLSTITC